MRVENKSSKDQQERMDLHEHLLKEKKKSNPQNGNLDCCGLTSQHAQSRNRKASKPLLTLYNLEERRT